jgi:hypothetical protein
VSREGAQQHRGAEIIVGGVVDDVEEVDAEADHPGLVADVVDAAQGRCDGLGIPDVGALSRVEHARVVPGGVERLDDVRADEAGASGDEDEHRRSVRPRARPSDRVQQVVMGSARSRA